MITNAKIRTVFEQDRLSAGFKEQTITQSLSPCTTLVQTSTPFTGFQRCQRRKKTKVVDCFGTSRAADVAGKVLIKIVSNSNNVRGMRGRSSPADSDTRHDANRNRPNGNVLARESKANSRVYFATRYKPRS